MAAAIAALVSLGAAASPKPGADRDTVVYIHVVGAADTRVRDREGRATPCVDRSCTPIPNCQRWDNVSMRPQTSEQARVPRVQIALLKAAPDQYDIAVSGTGDHALLEFSVRVGDSLSGMNDRVRIAPGQELHWRASWSWGKLGGRPVVVLRRQPLRGN